MKFQKIFAFVALVAFVALFATQPAHAYLDVTQGSMMVQALMGGFAAMGVLTRFAWHRMVSNWGGCSEGD